MKKNKDKEAFIKTRKRMDNSVEIELRKSPAKTKLGKVIVYLIVAGTVLLPVVALIWVLIDRMNQ
ncbi:MAG: hypothetical protein WC008_00385 [Bacilli bacterium]